MGILRLYLALCVVAAHSSPILPWSMHDGNRAVQIFYIISGFYMAMVLSSRYSNKYDFYLSRFLRIFPLYWIVLLLIVVWSLFSGFHHGFWLTLRGFASHPVAVNGPTGVWLSSLSNITIFGQDWVMFSSHPVGTAFHLTKSFGEDASPLWHYLIMPQAWSVGVELTFYALAPFFNRMRTPELLLMIGAVFLLRFFAASSLHLNFDPWTYRFFPFEISQFLLGMLGFRLYAHIRTNGLYGLPSFDKNWQFFIALAVIPGMFLLLHLIEVYFLGHSTWAWRALCTCPLWAVGIVLLFILVGNNLIDRWIGELSYPVYLVHYTIAASLQPYVPKVYWGCLTGLLSVTLSVILYFTVIRPIDIKRHFLTIHNFKKLIGKALKEEDVYGPAITETSLPTGPDKTQPPYLLLLIPLTILFLSILSTRHPPALFRVQIAGVIIAVWVLAICRGWTKLLYHFLSTRLRSGKKSEG